jgi:hypothetical protein
VEANITQAKIDLAKSLRQLALDTNKLYNEDTEIWEGKAINLVEGYSTVLYETFRRDAYESKKNKKKTWTFWNSVFYCGTIYTTIGGYSIIRSGKIRRMSFNFLAFDQKPQRDFELLSVNHFSITESCETLLCSTFLFCRKINMFFRARKRERGRMSYTFDIFKSDKFCGFIA